MPIADHNESLMRAIGVRISGSTAPSIDSSAPSRRTFPAYQASPSLAGAEPRTKGTLAAPARPYAPPLVSSPGATASGRCVYAMCASFSTVWLRPRSRKLVVSRPSTPTGPRAWMRAVLMPTCAQHKGRETGKVMHGVLSPRPLTGHTDHRRRCAVCRPATRLGPRRLMRTARAPACFPMRAGKL